MPLIKDDIIDRSLLNLGENTIIYNSNLTDQKAIASSLFDNIIRSMCLDENFMFNLVSETQSMIAFFADGVWNDALLWNDEQYWNETDIVKSDINEFMYTLPEDFMGLLAVKQKENTEYQGEFNSSSNSCDNTDYRIQGNNLYCNKDEIVIFYFKRYELSDLPLYFEEYLVYSLAYEMTKAYTTYQDKAQLMMQERNSAKKIIMNREGLPFPIKY